MFSRILLKHVLGNALGIPHEEVEWEYDGYGHPYIPGVPDLDFSLAHSGSHMAVAIAENLKVGIDIEKPDSGFDYAGIAKTFFNSAEYRWIISADGAAAGKRFMYLWCLKEACGKKNGSGLNDEILKMSFLSVPGNRPGSGEKFISGMYRENIWTVCWTCGDESSVSVSEMFLTADRNGCSVRTLPMCRELTLYMP